MEDVKRSLDEVQYTLNGVDERNWSSILGGPSAGFILDIAFNPDVTHESYFEQLEAYKQSRKESSVDG